MAVGQRAVTSAAGLRVLAHPLRLRLLELLGAEGPFTASEAARRLDESAANISWHLRELGKHGFVRQSRGPGRTRPWRYVAQSLTSGDAVDDPAGATALTDVLHEREFQVLRASIRERSREPQIWRDAAFVVQSRLWLTAQEAQRIGRLLEEALLAEGIVDRNADAAARPAGARLMALMAWVVPMEKV